ncbi:glycoside hydrolase family 64 protein [Crossiella sp. SN42]|uniref:glycoside hydrolase family 64 protein n=1 Tax=Crossiella sp. SN42 TaxID=2944808 RepID=UPI00207C2428|nr:glycoside hydrolase family 64 protein [Crossiella sp. SN42]MCO1579799.1 glycoside hydrolase family 64 protein [Crossiella sp. SN42]
MISRRLFLGASATALATPALGQLAAHATTAATPQRFTLNLVNNSGSATAYAYVVGLSGNRPLFVRRDGSSYYPPSPGSPVTPLGEDPSIALGGPGSSTTVSIPRMYGARIYVVTGAKLNFFVNPGPHIVHPSFLNPGDPNINKNWTFAEFTFNEAELFANISYVDFVAAPLGLSLRSLSGRVETVPGLPAGALDGICAALQAQASKEGSAWNQLIQKGPDGRNLRAMSAHYKASAFANYLGGYIDQCWAKYAGTDLVVDTQSGAGRLTGRVSGGVLRFNNGETFTKPSTADVFSCDSGPFSLAGASEVRKAIIPRLAAALNRTTLLSNPNQPHGEVASNFYRTPATNHYARIVHERLPDNRGYAFPYDDVSPGPDFSGATRSGDPGTLTVDVKRLR